jgi:phosphate transport system substrate-binding protein
VSRQLFSQRLFNLIVAVLLFSLCACGSGGGGDQKQSGTQTTIRVSGAWALYPMMGRWAEEFAKTRPGCRIDVAAGGAGKGVADALAGLVDIGMVSREIKREESQRGAQYVPVVKDAVFPVMNANSPALRVVMSKGLMKKQFMALWIEGKALSWGELTGGSIGDRVQVYTRSDACGAGETWAGYLGKHQEDLKGLGVYGDPGIAEAVRKDSLGVGYNNLNYAYDAKTGLPVKGIQVLPIDVNENGKIDPQEDLSTKQKAISAVVSGTYPSPPARDLYLITKGEFKGTVKEFVRWILTDGQKYVEEVGYIKLSQSQVKEALQKLGE